MRTELHVIRGRDHGAGHGSEAAQVVAWRTRQLAAAGFDPGLAAELAAAGTYDLHALIELVESGCPPPLAARILAPLEDRARETGRRT
jgi:hypothetical protein